MPLHICGVLLTEFVNSRVNEFADEFAVLGAGVSSLMRWHLSGLVIMGDGGMGKLNAHRFSYLRRIFAQRSQKLEGHGDIFVELFVCS
jgi:hypothetical protein